MSLEVTHTSSLADGGAALEYYLRHEDTLKVAEEFAAEQFAKEIRYALGVPSDIRTLTPEVVDRLYDPSLPTVAIDCQHAYAGSELLGVAASRSADCQLNVIYLNVATAQLESAVDDTGTRLRAHRGIMLDSTGDVYTGRFPHPVEIDAIETVDLELLSRASETGVQTVSHSERMQFINDKANLPALAEMIGVQTPLRLSPDQLQAGVDAVIKPSKGSQGRGVYFTASHPDNPEKWQNYYNFLQAHGYEPIIEEKIRCWPAFDPQTGERLDWNVRAIVSHGQPVNMYVRAGAIDTPINKSTGARSVPMKEFGKLLEGAHGATARVITHALENAAADIAERFPAFVTGLDLTINERGEVVMFEANAGHVGGPQTMAHINQGSLNARLKDSHQILQGIAEQIPKKPTPSRQSSDFRPFDPSFESKVDFILSAHHEQALYGYLATTPPPEDSSLNAKMTAKLVESEVSHLLQPDIAQMHIAELLDRYPLELSSHPYLLSSRLLASRALAVVMAVNGRSDIVDDEWKVLNAHRAAVAGDFRSAMSVYRELRDEGKINEAKTVRSRIVRHAADELPRGQNAEYLKATKSALAVLADRLCDENTEGAYELRDALDALIDTLDPKDEWRMLLVCGLTRLELLSGNFEQASLYAAKIDIDDDQQGDFILDLMTVYSDLLLGDAEGSSFYIAQQARFGLYGPIAAELIGEAREQKRSIHPHILDSLANVHAEFTDNDRRYYRQAIVAAAEDVETIPEPDATSALQLLGYVIWSQSRPEQAIDTQEMCKLIAESHPEFRCDIEYFWDNSEA